MQDISPSQDAPTSLMALVASQKRLAFATGYAYIGLICMLICCLLMSRTRWVWPFLIVGLICSSLGRASSSRYYLAEFSLFLCTIFINIIVGSLFYLGQQQDQLSRLQYQQVQLLNQQIQLQDQRVIFQKQAGLFKDLNMADNKKHAEQAAKYNVWVAHLVGEFIHYDYFYIQKNSQIFYNESTQLGAESDALSQAAQEIKENIWLIANNTALIKSYNASLPADKQVVYRPRPYLSSCPQVALCAPPAWQQSFIDGWQAIAGHPLTTTWPFWAGLSGVVLSLVALSFVYQPAQTVAFQILSNEALGAEHALSESDQQWLTYPAKARHLTIGLWGPAALVMLGRVKHDFVSFDFGADTRVISVTPEREISTRPRSRPRRKAAATPPQTDDQPLAFLDRDTHAVIFQSPGGLSRPGSRVKRPSGFSVVLGAFPSQIKATSYVFRGPAIREMHPQRKQLFRLENGINYLSRLALCTLLFILLMTTGDEFFNASIGFDNIALRIIMLASVSLSICLLIADALLRRFVFK